MRRLVLLTVTILALLACGSSDGSAGDDGSSGDGGVGPSTEDAGGTPQGAERVDIGGSEALVWGDGRSGVLLAHGAAFDAASWANQATAIAEQDATALALEDISPEAINAGVTYLRDELGTETVALVGGSAGSNGILDAASEDPELGDQLILMAATSPVEGLGTQPKLFIASEGDPVADVSRELADTAAGDDNQVEILPGDAHAQNIFDTDQADTALNLILDRLAQFGP